MPIDTSIYRLSQPVEDPIQSYGKVLSLKNMLQQQQMHAQQLQAATLENQQRQHAQDGEKALADALQKNTQQGPDGSQATNHAGVLSDLTAKGQGALAIKYDADKRANQKAEIENAKNQLANTKQQAEMLGQGLGAVRAAPDDQKQAVYTQVRNDAIQKGIIKSQDAPEAYDPQFVETHFQAAVSAPTQLAEHDKALTHALALNQFDQTKANNQIKNAKDWQAHATQLMSAASNPEQWKNSITTLRANGAPDSVISQFAPEYSPQEQARVAQLGMTPEQRQTNAGAKETRDATKARDAANLAHQKVMEGQGAAHIGISAVAADPYGTFGINKRGSMAGGSAAGGSAQTFNVQTPDGQVHKFKSQAAANGFKQAAGIKE